MATLTNTTVLEILDTAPILVGGVNSIGEIGFGQADEIDVTTLNETDGYKKFIQGLKDSGILSIGGFKEATDAGQAKLIELQKSGKVVTFRITYSDGAVAEFSGFVKKFNFAATAISTALLWAVDIRLNGSISYTEAVGSLGTLAISMAAAGSGTGTVTVSGVENAGLLVYKTGESLTAPSYLSDLSDWTGLPLNHVVEAESGDQICVALINYDGECLAASNVISVVVGA